MHKYFRLPTCERQNIPKEISLIFLKIREKTPGRPGYIKKFRLKMGGATPYPSPLYGQRVNPNFRKYGNSRKPGNFILSVDNYYTLTLVILV